MLTGGQGTQTRYSVGVFTCYDGGQHAVSGAVMIEGVSYIGKGQFGARTVQPIGQYPGRRGHPLCRLAGHDQR
jgi:hypothetical protein